VAWRGAVLQPAAPAYPRLPFAGLGFAQRWMARFVGSGTTVSIGTALSAM